MEPTINSEHIEKIKIEDRFRYGAHIPPPRDNPPLVPGSVLDAKLASKD